MRFILDQMPSLRARSTKKTVVRVEPSLHSGKVSALGIDAPFDASLLTRAIRSDVKETLQACREIGLRDLDRVYAAALSTITSGGSLPPLFNALMSIDGMPRNRASEIALHVYRRSQSAIDRGKMEKLRIVDVVWKYSNSPCASSQGTLPHASLDGKQFKLADGLKVDNRATWPGMEIGCKCFLKPIISWAD